MTVIQVHTLQQPLVWMFVKKSIWQGNQALKKNTQKSGAELNQHAYKQEVVMGTHGM